MKVLILVALIPICLLLKPQVLFAYDWQEVVIVNALILADWSQTREISKNPNYIEHNPILGENPSVSKVDKYIGLGLLAYNVFALILPDKYERVLTRTLMVVEAGVVIRNNSIGIEFDF